MRFALRAVLTVAVLAVAASAWAPAAESRSATRLHCQQCKDDIGGGQHVFNQGGAMMDCHACNSCHTDWQAGWCTEYHCDCGVSFQDAKANLDVIVAAVESGDEAQVRGILTKCGHAVQYNGKRDAVQVLSCYREIVAHLPVSRSLAVALE
jgi:hypothetical protein